jgi:hypothetical protein
VTSGQQLLDAFERERWKSNPYERMLDIAHHDTAELLELVLQSMDRLENSATFIDGALSFLDEPQFDAVVEHAVRHVKNSPERVTGESVAESVIAYASMQFAHLLSPHLPLLWTLAPNQSSYYCEWPWRAAGDDERERLIRLLQEEAESRVRAWRAVLETRSHRDIEKALAFANAAPPFLHAEPARWLPIVGYVLDDQELRRAAPRVCFHLELPEPLIRSRWDRPAHLLPSNHATWHGLGPATQRARIGGLSAASCGICGGRLHRLLALTDVPNGLGVTTRSRLELATCLSCLGWSGPWLFYAHGDDGVPQPTETQRTRSVPEFPSGPLAEADIGLVPTPSRWLYQDWALSNGRENLNRLGGEPTWIQDADYPSCPGCGHPMNGLMQLDSDLATDDEGEFLWGSGGIAYVVWCDHCAISGVTAQWT